LLLKQLHPAPAQHRRAVSEDGSPCIAIGSNRDASLNSSNARSFSVKIKVRSPFEMLVFIRFPSSARRQIKFVVQSVTHGYCGMSDGVSVGQSWIGYFE
jgi:hypothetical protein